ncbi:hypothetical protein [Dactylosporangium sp. CS-033363]|uniref:hypothetical protein n=1 Tax=Dactylosporangium sp. CS-033363 TaxID=3239935 RepID=UPI003D8F3F6C
MGTAQTPQTMWLRGENGLVLEHALPLSEPLAERLLKGYLTRVADADGSPYVEPAPEAAVSGAADPTAPPADIAGTSPETPETPEIAGTPADAADGSGISGNVTERPTAPARPTRRDRKAVWVGYVVRHVTKVDGTAWPAEEADGMSIPALEAELDRWAAATGVEFVAAG